MSLKKQYLKNRPVCKVTFNVPKGVVGSAKKVNLVGEFNNWDPAATPMKRLPNGAFTVSLELETGKEYQFRYLLNRENWVNDQNADKYAAVPDLNTENSVVVV
jgi:1,4-alpha-glucan branching enzyme